MCVSYIFLKCSSQVKAEIGPSHLNYPKHAGSHSSLMTANLAGKVGSMS